LVLRGNGAEKEANAGPARLSHRLTPGVAAPNRCVWRLGKLTRRLCVEMRQIALLTRRIATSGRDIRPLVRRSATCRLWSPRGTRFLRGTCSDSRSKDRCLSADHRRKRLIGGGSRAYCRDELANAHHCRPDNMPRQGVHQGYRPLRKSGDISNI
jgi:hypothetical protein